MELPDDTIEQFRAGFAALRADFGVPGDHPPEVHAAAEEAALRPFDVVELGGSPGRW